MAANDIWNGFVDAGTGTISLSGGTLTVTGIVGQAPRKVLSVKAKGGDRARMQVEARTTSGVGGRIHFTVDGSTTDGLDHTHTEWQTIEIEYVIPPASDDVTLGFNIGKLTGTASSTVEYRRPQLWLNGAPVSPSSFMTYTGFGLRSSGGPAGFVAATEIFGVDANSRFILGAGDVPSLGGGYRPRLFNHGSDASDSGIATMRHSADSGRPAISMVKTRATTVGANAATASNDVLGELNYYGDYGTGFWKGASIIALQDGAAGASFVPTILQFYVTSAAGALSEHTRLRTDGDLDIRAGELRIAGTQVVGARGAALPADATDLASAIALVNAVKARMKATGGHGLVAD